MKEHIKELVQELAELAGAAPDSMLAEDFEIAVTKWVEEHCPEKKDSN